MKKFSSFFKRIVILFPNGEKKEWMKAQLPRETDGIEIKFTGYVEAPVKILLYLDHFPLKLKLSPALSAFMGIQ